MAHGHAVHEAIVRHPAQVFMPRGLRKHAEPAGAALGVEDGATEQQVGALVLAALLCIGGVLGMLNLFVDGVVRDGARWLYGVTMLLLLVASAVLAALRRAGVWATFGLVLLGDLVYVVVSLSVVDAARYSTPLMLLFAAFIAAWFLGPWMLAAHMVVIPLACLVSLWGSFDSVTALAIQVLVSSGVLNSASLGVFVLRRRFERLLVESQAATRIDPLTGLHNRRYVAEQASRIWRQARRDGTRVAAMVLDLDHFKEINDIHGHAAGDAVLQSVARSLAATVRPADVLARTGGEELVVIGMVSDSDESARLAERLRAAVADSRSVDDHRVTASIGVALVRPVGGEDAVSSLWRLVDLADVAMYEAKHAGRDRIAGVPVPLPRATRREETAVADPPVSGAA
jgi:diguanylate cyclase (GGDEF)-like protein